MSFIPGADEQLRSHFVDVPERTVAAIGSLARKHILDVGCGNMLSDFGLLAKGAAHVTGLDIKPLPDGILARQAADLRAAGLDCPADYATRLSHIRYDGRTFPFRDNNYDVVFSWSAFEHIADVEGVLREMKRVLKSAGVCFIQVFPWFHSFHGSHLTDYIAEPFAHLKRPDEWMRAQLEAYCGKNSAQRDFILGHMWREYQQLNRFSADKFYAAVKAVGWRSQRWSLLAYPQDLAEAPPEFGLSELMICGSDVVLRK
jgi:ubiquinone/menaquinone biosynthesis C-methylase UbiE